MLAKAYADRVLQSLRVAFDIQSATKNRHDPYETLVITIISQNTADTNTARAFQNLQNCFQITPQILGNASLNRIEACLLVGGLYHSKAKTIRTASRILLERFGGSLNAILMLPVEEARKTLMEMPGIGPKTADVVLLFSANLPTLPVDTHVNRVSKRLGLAPADGGYEEVRLSLQSYFEPKDYLAVHLLLISLGRKHCKAHKSSCGTCPVNMYCPSNNLGDMA